MKSRRLMFAGLAAILSVLSAAGVSAQSDAGECGVEPRGESDTGQGGLFVLGGIEFDEAGLSMAMQQALFDARLQFYKEQLKIIDSAVLQAELDRRAVSSGKDPQALAQELFSVPPPDENAIATFYDANRAQIPYPLDQVRGQIRQMLTQQQMRQKQQALLAGAKQAQDFRVTLKPPVAPYAEINTYGYPSKGPADAKLTLIEFADYQCPHCQKAAEALRKVGERYADDLRIVFMDFPVNPSGISRTVAEGAACADRQDRFWAYHDLAFDRQAGLNPGSAAGIAAELGLDSDKFEACMKSEIPLQRVARAEGEARRLGLSGTPTFFLNGRRLHLHDIESGLVDAINRELGGATGS